MIKRSKFELNPNKLELKKKESENKVVFLYKDVLDYLFETFKTLPPIYIDLNIETYLFVDQIVRKVI